MCRRNTWGQTQGHALSDTLPLSHWQLKTAMLNGLKGLSLFLILNLLRN
jgi:hypothetical protein